MKLKVKIPATSANFGSGFDVFGSALKLYNEIEVQNFESKSEKLRIEIEGEGDRELSKDEKNIVWQAIKKIFNILKITPPHLYIKLKNSIPLARGLGSSASARIGGLVIANRICGNKLSEKEIIKIATELEGHPDNVVPAMVGGFCVVVKKNKNEIEYVKFNMPENLQAVLCIPEIKVLTEYARKILPMNVPYEDAVFNCSRTALLVSAISQKKFYLLKTAMEDKLHQKYRKRLIPGMDDVFSSALKLGCSGVALSGSGPTIIAIVDKNSKVIPERIGKAMVSAFSKNNIKSRYILCNFENKGVEFVK